MYAHNTACQVAIQCRILPRSTCRFLTYKVNYSQQRSTGNMCIRANYCFTDHCKVNGRHPLRIECTTRRGSKPCYEQCSEKGVLLHLRIIPLYSVPYGLFVSHFIRVLSCIFDLVCPEILFFLVRNRCK